MATATIRIQGLHEAIRSLDSDIITGPARNLLTRAGISVQGKAREYAPVDRGGLWDSITYEVDSANMPRWVEVGSNLEYAREKELGRNPGSMPPVDALEAWARRKGLGEGAGWPIALHIMAHGNEPRPFLMPALNDTKPKIPRLVATMAREIEAAAAAAGGGAT